MGTLLILVLATLLATARIGLVIWAEFKEAGRVPEAALRQPLDQARVLPFQRKPPAA